MITALPRTVIAYCRASTEDQTLSVDVQRAAIAHWCAAYGATLLAVYTDAGISGAMPLEKRPGLLAAMGALKRGMGLVITKRDRLARDTLTAAMCERIAQKAGASIISVDGAGAGDTPEAALMRSIIDAFAQYERALIKLRTKTALQRKRAKGERVGSLPYGYRLVDDRQHLVPDPAEQAVIAVVRELRAHGLTTRAIARELNRRGLANRAGGRFGHTQVIRILNKGQAA